MSSLLETPLGDLLSGFVAKMKAGGDAGLHLSLDGNGMFAWRAALGCAQPGTVSVFGEAPDAGLDGVAVTFPTPFSEAPLFVIASVKGDDPAITASVGSISAAGCTLYATALCDLTYMAIGKE